MNLFNIAMIPLIILVGVSALYWLYLKLTKGKADLAEAGRMGLSAMLVFTAMGHFYFPQGMSMMIPDMIPYKLPLVYITSILEILFAIGIQIKRYRKISAWLLMIFLVVILPANIYAAYHNIDFQLANHGGPGPEYLWFRIPLQIVFILWTYFSCLKPSVKYNITN